ncbi:3-oxoacyl-[acyl-carrier-protein] reductase [Nitrospirillum amazonense]|uniref:3-oxoacyl-[acyl-carrier-protein] reductase n=1 Tax=Nitrospirillum amazonense TaxID=28077 RepID=A0A560FFE6_9PROT|nr:acetoacetyl-CoA reductase [Nitrospirillum amazonense]TWB20331.1 3-oxoacyl-[acyl-carrier-protein] reductase [Nitrospirillum amazonense]
MVRVALVTGGVTGIGAAVCLALKAAGHTVVATCAPADEAMAATFQQATGLPTVFWDVADYAACADGVAGVTAAHGPIDILVNNAGITRDAMLHKMTPEQWRAVIDVDLGGCFNMCRAVIESMRERRYGRIINISSVNALSGQAGQTNYAAAKAGLIGFTKALALEGASRNITVNAVAPGYTKTAMVEAVPADILQTIVNGIPAKRLAQPEEIARAVAFLAADDTGFITGETLSVNGGKYMQ